MWNSLAQLAVKITAPGVPDFYQGTELWDLSLVDPDNRRPVDFARRRSLLEALTARIAADRAAGADATGLCRELVADWPDGRVKLYLTHRALTLRRARARLFALGAYRALGADGPRADHVIALARTDGADAVVVAVPRLTARLAGLTGSLLPGETAWEHTAVGLDEDLAGVYRDRFTGLEVTSERREGRAVLPAGSLFAHFPVALLERVAVSPVAGSR
jgi:(1->4)-alpha-D-glucan 1-alpha-D-glucosylmutase